MMDCICHLLSRWSYRSTAFLSRRIKSLLSKHTSCSDRIRRISWGSWIPETIYCRDSSRKFEIICGRDCSPCWICIIWSKRFWMGNIPTNQLCQLRNMMTKIFASKTLACLTVINTQIIASYISSNLKLIWLNCLNTNIPSFLQSSSEVASCQSDNRLMSCLNP